MGFLLTAAAARVLQAPLRFVSLEKWLLPAPVLEGVHRPLLADPYLFLDSQGRSALASIEGTEVFRHHYRQLLDRFIEWRTALPLECPDGEYSLAGDDGIQLELRIGDACHDASVSKKGEEELFDAIYFDAFSPKSSPDLWSVETLRRAHALLKPDGLFSTYCVSSQVRRQLGEAGFLVERIPGPPGGKREVLRATKVK